MSESRDYSLPAGLSDIGQFIQFQQSQKQCGAIPFFGSTTMRLRGWESVAIFYKLSRRIDQDLLFTDEVDLLWPRIQEVVLEELNRVIEDLELDLPLETRNGMVKAMQTAVWMEIRRRPRVGSR